MELASKIVQYGLVPVLLIGAILVSFLGPGRTPADHVPVQPESERIRRLAILGSAAGIIVGTLYIWMNESIEKWLTNLATSSWSARLPFASAVLGALLGGLFWSLFRKFAGKNQIAVVCTAITSLSVIALMQLFHSAVSEYIVVASLCGALTVALLSARHRSAEVNERTSEGGS